MTTSELQKRSGSEVEPSRAPAGRRLTPAVDIFENGEGFLIVADLPNVEAEALTVEYNPPELRVSARATAANGNGGTPFYYERRFEIGAGIDVGSINAELKNGVLRVELKKSAELKPRKISVRAA